MVEYIEREALCYQLAKQATIDGQPRAIRRAAKIVTDFPAADVRPVVKATWKRIDYKPLGHDYKCSSCGWKNDMETHYCPDCGALMEES
jgi:lipopolysaccharide biosynthesis regulator YciM